MAFAIEGIDHTGRIRREHTKPSEALATYIAWRQKADVINVRIFLYDGRRNEAISEIDLMRLSDSEKSSDA